MTRPNVIDSGSGTIVAPETKAVTKNRVKETGLGPLAILAALALAACSANNDKVAISSAESALTVGGHAVLAYDALPLCPLNTPLCHTDAIKAQAKGAFNAAYDNVTRAQATADAGGKPDVVAVQAAITALQSVVSMFPKAQ